MERSNRQFLAKVWRPLLKEFSLTLDRACLRRDAYLNHVFAHEAKALKEEIPCRNSQEARAYLQNRLEELDRVPVNFSLSPATIKAVNRVCEERNVIRDCFINRVLFLLIADINTCEAVTGIKVLENIPGILGDHDRDYIYAPLWGGGLRGVSEIVSSDPFWALRNIIDHFREQGDEDVTPLHACLIRPEMFSKAPGGIIALNCYLSDERIPGSPASKLATEWGEILGQLTSTSENSAESRQKNETKAEA